MKSYLNNTTLKKRFVAEVEKHRKADAIVQGTYGAMTAGKWKGCAVACSLRSLAIIEDETLRTLYSDHQDYEVKLGIPEWLARLEDQIFEGLPKKEAMLWPSAFAKAVPVGKDLDPIKWKFCAFLLSRNIERVLTLKIDESLKKQVVDAIRGVLTLHESAIKTGNWNQSAEESARSVARNAAESAWSASESAARSAEESAWSAARSASESAWSAWSASESAWSAWGASESAWCAARSVPESAGSVEYILYSKHLISLLKSVK